MSPECMAAARHMTRLQVDHIIRHEFRETLRSVREDDLGAPPAHMWFRRTTSTPQYSRVRQTVSPMMVERRWPTCISLATLGDEKSTTARLQDSLGAQVETPSTSMALTRLAMWSRDTLMLMKPVHGRGGVVRPRPTANAWVGRGGTEGRSQQPMHGQPGQCSFSTASVQAHALIPPFTPEHTRAREAGL